VLPLSQVVNPEQHQRHPDDYQRPPAGAADGRSEHSDGAKVDQDPKHEELQQHPC
jgi:hypothetical protein